jgi:CorA-like Mg2+ transporter protein
LQNRNTAGNHPDAFDFATVILLPQTLIAGIYGMNGIDLNKLETLPEGFILIIIIMASIGIGSLIFFIKKQWLGVRSRNDESESVHEVNVRE